MKHLQRRGAFVAPIAVAVSIATALLARSAAAAESGVAPPPITAAPVLALPSLDLAAIEAGDAARAAAGLPPRYAVPNAVDLGPADAGRWTTQPDGTQAWRLRLACPGARSMNVGFTTWRPPAGARLRLLDGDGALLVRPFTAADGATHGELWTPPTAGDGLGLELLVPAGAEARAAAEAGVRLGSINPGYRGFGAPGELAEASLPCNIDVACPEGDDWRLEAAGVAVISTGGSTFCTGFMVTNVRGDRTPYFMTANHCGIDVGNAASLVAFWHFENSFCRPPGSPESAGPGDGTLDRFTTGSTFRAAWGPSDFTLVELDATPDPAWGVPFLGFSAVDVAPDGAVGIHHPGTEEKRISFDFDPTELASYGGGGLTHVQVMDWDLGTTEGGSSGSPLFDLEGRVVGQLHGGNCAPQPCDFCDEVVFDFYGRVARSWNGGGTPSTRLRDWLDPDATGVLVSDTLPATDFTATPAGDVLHVGPVGGPFTPGSVTMLLSNLGDAPAAWTASTTGALPLLLGDRPAPASGVLAPGETDELVVSLDPSAGALSAGVYTGNVSILAGEGTTFAVEHRLEIAQADVRVADRASRTAAGPVGGPFTGGGSYVLENLGSVDAEVAVTVDAAWAVAPPAIVVVPAGGIAEVPLAPGPGAAGLPAGAVLATLRLENRSGSLLDGDVGLRHLSLDVGGTVDPDECASPRPVRSGVWPIDTTGATTGMPFDDFDQCEDWGSPQVHRDVWYRFEACADGTLTASTCGTVSWDSRIAIYRGDGCAATMIACNDDGAGCSGYSSLVEAPVQAGRVYLVRTGSWVEDGAGTGTIRIEGPDDCPCPEDVDGNGSVGFTDLTALLGSWGPCPGCPADIDGSGAVDFPDLTALLAAWGPC